MREVLVFFKRYAIYILFGLYYIVGLLCFQDYGLNWDDFAQRLIGYNNFLCYVEGDASVLYDKFDKYYGPFLETILIVAQRAFGYTEVPTKSTLQHPNIFKLNHFILFNLFFVATIVFYLLLRKYFDKSISLIGCLFLVLSPRFFAESFYNSKDLGFLCFFIFSIFSLINLIEKKNISWLIIHAFTSAFLIDVRIIGIIIPPVTIAFYLYDVLHDKTSIRKALLYVVLYLFLLSVIVVAFYPVLWPSPLTEFINAYNRMKTYPWISTVFFMGKNVMSNNLPWYYIPVWMLITIPELYSILFFIGIYYYVRLLIKDKLKSYKSDLLLHISVILLFMPVFSVIALHSIVYDGWRHLYFIYPLFIVIALYGFCFLLKTFSILKHFFYGALSVYFLIVLTWMFINHPYQNVYFNFTSRTLCDAGNKFEKDYWGLSHKQGLEYLAKQHTESKPLKVAFMANTPGVNNLLFLQESSRKKFQYVDKFDSTWNYFFCYYRDGVNPENLTKVKTIDVDGYPIIGIYKK